MGVATVEEYLASFPDDVRVVLGEVRAAIRSAIPDATELMSYGIVRCDVGDRKVVYFGGWNHHVGMYPVPVQKPALEAELAPFRSTKDSVHFPYRGEIPYGLITRIVASLAARG